MSKVFESRYSLTLNELFSPRRPSTRCRSSAVTWNSTWTAASNCARSDRADDSTTVVCTRSPLSRATDCKWMGLLFYFNVYVFGRELNGVLTPRINFAIYFFLVFVHGKTVYALWSPFMKWGVYSKLFIQNSSCGLRFVVLYLVFLVSVFKCIFFFFSSKPCLFIPLY